MSGGLTLGLIERQQRQRRPRGAPTNQPHRYVPVAVPVTPNPRPTIEEVPPIKHLLKHISRYLDLKEVLALRLISKEWNDFICSPQLILKRDSHHKYHHRIHQQSSILWTKARLLNEAPRNKESSDRSRYGHEKSRELVSNFEEFIRNCNTLITRYHCPNYHFRFVDARFEIVRNFFTQNGTYIRNLRLNNCIMSLVSFQRIIQSCPNLQIFEVTGTFHCISHTESLFSSKHETHLAAFKNLTKLYLESTYVARMVKYKILNSNFVKKSTSNEIEVKIQDIHPTVVREILLSATQLESLRFSGFGIMTVIRVLKTLGNEPVHHKIIDLGFYNIPDPGVFTYTYLSNLQDLTHMKLKKFALTFLTNGLQTKDESTVTTTEEKDNLDIPIQNLLSSQYTTLEELDLTNCDVTQFIFFANGPYEYSNLRKLRLHGTNITELSDYSRVVLQKYLESKAVELGTHFSEASVDVIIDEALRDAHQDEIDTEFVLEENEFSTSEKKPDGSNFFYTCSIVDKICLRIVWGLGILGICGLCIFWIQDTNGQIIFTAIAAFILIIYSLYRIYV